MDTAGAVTVTKHDQEVVRILGKMARMRGIAIGVVFVVFVLGMLGLKAVFGTGTMVWIASILGTGLLVASGVLVALQRKTRRRLVASMGKSPPVAFSCADGSYFFINQEGVFIEQSLWFVPFEGLSFVRELAFEPGTRKLTIRIQNGKQGQHRSEVVIDVPPGYPGEHLELLSAALRDEHARSAAAG